LEASFFLSPQHRLRKRVNSRSSSKPASPLLQESLAPFADRLVGQAEPLRDRGVGLPLAQAKTIRARWAKACAVHDRRAQR